MPRNGTKRFEIASLLKVWVLTGDKKETAINISFSCGHFMPAPGEMNKIAFELRIGFKSSGLGQDLKNARYISGP